MSRARARSIFQVLVMVVTVATWLPAVDEVAPALAPQPVTAPLPPDMNAHRDVDPDAQLLQRLERLIKDRDQRMSTMLQSGVVLNPVADRRPRSDDPDPATLEARTVHAAARRDLRLALEQAAKRSHTGTQDVLDRASPRTQAAQTGPLAALNQLAIAECWKDLASSPDGSAADVEAGLAALTTLDASRLGEGERPRMLYLALWFQLESVRKLPRDAPATERSTRLAIARERQADLVNQYPASPLAQTADALFSGIVLP